MSDAMTLRKEPMKRYTYTLAFHTPAFLGEADQRGEWRTPPFKALLRQWWRVAHVARAGCDVSQLRAEEEARFGTAADEKGGAKGRSQVLMRLSHWKRGGLARWERIGDAVHHPEVGQINPDLYLGYGPIDKGTVLKKGAALQAGECAVLSIAFPESLEAELRAALLLMHRFATAGGRSRNGWGSFTLAPADPATPPLTGAIDAWLREWKTALALDWPHAIGADEKGPLVWRSRQPFASWREAMVELARIKIALRTWFKFHSGERAKAPESRHWLSYPVTKHSVEAWGNNARLPNSLRFKVLPDGTGVRAWIFHLPCQPPPAFHPDRAALVSVWSRVHQHLDATPALERAK